VGHALSDGGRYAVMIDRLVVGGVEKTALQEVGALRAAGIDATLVVLKRDREVPAAFRTTVADIPVVFLDDRLPQFMRISTRIPGFTFFSLFHLLYAAAVPFVVGRREWTAILAHNSYTAMTAWSLAKVRGIPYAMFVWDPIDSVLTRAYPTGLVRMLRPVFLPLGRFADRVLARAAQRVLVSSATYVSYLGSVLPPHAVVKITPPGCSPVDNPRPRAGDHLLAATSWKLGKHLEDILRALPHLPDAHLVIAGRWLNPDYRGAMQRLIVELGLSSRVRFEGEYDDAGLATLASGALCSVTASAELGFGMPALEAAAQACTFVCPTVAGIAPFFDDGVEAFYFQEGDPDSLARALLLLVTDRELAHRAGLAAWKKARASFTWANHAETVATILLETGLAGSALDAQPTV
jgi:glycosyltransferase involved in cell wall biosynthesis